MKEERTGYVQEHAKLNYELHTIIYYNILCIYCIEKYKLEKTYKQVNTVEERQKSDSATVYP